MAIFYAKKIRRNLFGSKDKQRNQRLYGSGVFFGLSLRQIIFSAIACGAAVEIYFLLNPVLGTEPTSWLCIVGTAPFAALGFIKYNGMSAEKLLWCWIKSEFFTPKKLVFKSQNTYYEMMKDNISKKQKETNY